MRILLINPPWALKKSKNIWSRIRSCMPPLGLGWIAAVLENDGHEVLFLDANAEDIELNEIMIYLQDNGPFEILGVTATTPLIFNALEIVKKAKWCNPDMRVVLGGVHPTVLPDEVLETKEVDVVVRGEGEITMKEIAAGNDLTSINGISYRIDGKTVHNPDRELIKDIDSLPMPAYHLMPIKKYRPAVGAAKRKPAMSVMATRGCPGKCTFCYRIFGPRLRFRSGEKVAEEVKYLQDRYGIKEVAFYDDTFTSSKKMVKNFCKAIRKLKIDLTWSCFSRIDTFNEETCRLMSENGCHQIMYGIESFNQNILKNINKKYSVDKAEYVVKATQKAGIETRAAFMLGNPGDTEETMLQTICGAIKLKPDLAIFNITTPYPGTKMFEWADKNDYLLTKNWKDYDLSKPVLKLPTVSPETVQKMYNIAHRKFYLHPRSIIKRFGKMKTFDGVMETFQAAYAIIGK